MWCSIIIFHSLQKWRSSLYDIAFAIFFLSLFFLQFTSFFSCRLVFSLAFLFCFLIRQFGVIVSISFGFLIFLAIANFFSSSSVHVHVSNFLHIWGPDSQWVLFFGGKKKKVLCSLIAYVLLANQPTKRTYARKREKGRESQTTKHQPNIHTPHSYDFIWFRRLKVTFISSMLDNRKHCHLLMSFFVMLLLYLRYTVCWCEKFCLLRSFSLSSRLVPNCFILFQDKYNANRYLHKLHVVKHSSIS